MFQLPSHCGIPAPHLVTCSSKEAISAGCKQVAQSLGSLRRYAQTLPYVLSASSNTNSDPISALLLNAQIFQPCSQTQQQQANVEVSYHGTSLYINYRPTWFQPFNISVNDASETEYSTPIICHTLKESNVHNPETIAQHLKESIDSVRNMLMSPQKPHSLISEALTVIFQSLVSFYKEVNQHHLSNLPQAWWGSVIDNQNQEERDIFNGLDVVLQFKILFINLVQLSISIELCVQSRQLRGDIDQQTLPIYTPNGAESLLLQCTDFLAILFNDVEYTLCCKDQRLALLGIATNSLSMFYSSACQVHPNTHLSTMSYERYFLADLSHDLLNRQIHLLLDILGSSTVSSAMCTDIMSIFFILLDDSQATTLLSDAISSPYIYNTQTSTMSRSATEKLIHSILEHVIDTSINIKTELYKPPAFYRNIVLPKYTVQPPPLLTVLTKLLTLPSKNSSGTYIIHPKVALQAFLQQISTITNQKNSLKSCLMALLYQYMLELILLPSGSSVLWKDLSPMIVALCDKQFSSQLPSQSIITFVSLMLDVLAFLFLLALRNDSVTYAAQCSSQLLSFFQSFFSIISKNAQLQNYIISLLSRLSTVLQLAKSNYMDASISLDTSTNFLQAIDFCVMDICLKTLNSSSIPISLLDASLSSLIEPIQNGRFLPTHILEAQLLPRLKDLLRTTGSLSLIKSIVHLFVILVNRYYVYSQISATSLAVQLNTLMTVIMSVVIFTRDNTIAVGIVSILLPAMYATLSPVETAWKNSTNNLNRSAGLLICITSQNESRLIAFIRTIAGLSVHHKVILRATQREVLRILYCFLVKDSVDKTPPCDEVTILAESIPFSLFHTPTLAIIFFNLCGLSIILADELGDNHIDTVPLCASQKDSCICKLINNHSMTSVELEPKIKCTTIPLYVKSNCSGIPRRKEKSAKQTRKGLDISTVCSADTTAHMLLSIVSKFVDILLTTVQCTPLIDSAALWIEAYIVSDEHKVLFQAHAFRIISLSARIHINCLSNAEKTGKLDGSSAHMTTGSLLDQYNSIMSLLCSVIDTVDIYVIEHIVSCLVQYTKWDLFYRRYIYEDAHSLHVLCRLYVRTCIDSSRILVQSGYLEQTSELFCTNLLSKDSAYENSIKYGSIAKLLYLLTLLSRGFKQIDAKHSNAIKNTIVGVLFPTHEHKTVIESLHIAYSTPILYVLRLLIALRVSAHDIIHCVAVCQYILLGALPFIFIQSTDDAVAVITALKEDITQSSLHPLIADAIFYATVEFFNIRITEGVTSSVCSSIASEDTDSESKISLASLSVSTLKSPSSTTDYERPLTGVYISAKAEEKRLRIQKSFVHAVLPYCHTILAQYYFKGLFPSSADDSTMATKTIVHILYCIRQVIKSKLILPEFIVPNLIAFQLTACHANNELSTMTIVYEDVLDTLTLSLTVFKQLMCVVSIEKALQLLFVTDDWRLLVQRITNKNDIEAVLLSIKIPSVVLTDLYNIFFLETSFIGVPKKRDSDALLVSTILSCLELPKEGTDCNWYDTLLRFFFLLYILFKLPFCKYKSAVAVGTIIHYFTDYTVQQYQRLLLLDSTGGEVLPHTFVCDLFACLADCIVKLFTYYFGYTIKGEKEEIAKEPQGNLKLLNDIVHVVSKSIINPDGTLKELIDIKDSIP